MTLKNSNLTKCETKKEIDWSRGATNLSEGFSMNLQYHNRWVFLEQRRYRLSDVWKQVFKPSRCTLPSEENTIMTLLRPNPNILIYPLLIAGFELSNHCETKHQKEDKTTQNKNAHNNRRRMTRLNLGVFGCYTSSPNQSSWRQPYAQEQTNKTLLGFSSNPNF